MRLKSKTSLSPTSFIWRGPLTGFPNACRLSCVSSRHIEQTIDHPGKALNPARGQLNRENNYSAVSVRAREFGLARRAQPSRPASACSSPYTQGESNAFSRDSSLFPRRRLFIYLNRHTWSGQSRVYRVPQLRTGGVHCRESASTGPVVLNVVSVTGAVSLKVTMDQLMCASFFPHPPLVC